jgi:anti-anti-sigma factor
MFERNLQGAVDLIRGDDPLNSEHVDRLARVMDDCLLRGQPRIVLDLSKVPLIDSAGLEYLLNTQEECHRRGGALKLAAANPLCDEILSVTGVARQFDTFRDPTTAVGSFIQ